MQTIVSKDGTTLAYDKFGGGPALILVSGATALRAYGVTLAETLAPDFTVYTYDRRGRGDSGDTAPYAVEREIEDLEAMLIAAGGSAFVMGHSSGAVLTLRAAATGLPIEKLVVYEPPFIVDDSRPPSPEDYVEHLNELIKEDKRSEAFAYFMTTAVRVPPEYVSQMQEGPMWEAGKTVAHTIPYDGMVMGDTMTGRPLEAEPWSSISIPTLVLDGSESPLSMRSGAQALTALLPNGQSRTLAGQDHGPADDVLAPVLVAFYKG